MKPRISRRALTGAALGLLGAPALVRAQDTFPNRPITLVVPSPAGGGTDFSARLIADQLGRALGGSMVVENRPGGNDVVGLTSVLQARPDGHTLLCGYCGTMTGRVAVGTLGGIVPARDFIPIGQITDTPQLFVTHPSVPVNSMRDFIAYAKQRPGDLTYASAGVGSMHHLGAELLKLRAGIDMLHVPYRGTGETIRDLIAGRVRHPGMPNIPSAKEEGLADLDLNVWFSLFAPRGTPEPVARLLAQKLNEVLADPAIRKRAFDAGALVVPSTPEALAKRMERETAAWADVVRAAKITAG